jgi:hypothetical protein
VNLQEAILELLAAALPAVVLYFTGWSYLYFYLGAFAINISEINFDLPTVFIYSYPPLHALWEFYWLPIVAFVVGVVLVWLFAARLWAAAVAPRLTPCLAVEAAAIAARVRALSTTAWTLSVLFVLVLVLPLPLKSLTSFAAARAADRVWEGQAAELRPVFDKPPAVASRFDVVRLVTVSLWRKATKKERDAMAVLADDYETCQRRNAVSVVFAVEQRYYLLCRGAQVPFRGAVYEVKGKDGLLSVRSVHRTAAEGGG